MIMHSKKVEDYPELANQFNSSSLSDVHKRVKTVEKLDLKNFIEGVITNFDLPNSSTMSYTII